MVDEQVRRKDAALDNLAESLPFNFTDGRDELNLAEFPLAAIADRMHPGQKTMVFEDRIWDSNRGETISRQLTITGSDEHGLPTALDDEVLLGLIQLSKFRNFAERKVHFTRYQLLQLLGWSDDSKNYARLDISLNRWAGVTLYYQNAWWNREQQSWVDESFHVLDNVSLFDREKSARHASASHQAQLPFSSFLWNELIYGNFKAGNLKSLDFDLYRRLKSSVSKRLYRFLDKRFYHRGRWVFDLHELCWGHIGLSRNYDTGNLKRKLNQAIEELIGVGYLSQIPEGDRFRKIRSGQWRVTVERASRVNQSAMPAPVIPASVEASPHSLLHEALVNRGVTPTTAKEIVVRYPSDRILPQVEVFDWLLGRGDARVSRNPAGFLISSIREEYRPPNGFVSLAERQRRAKAAARRKENEEKKRLEAQEREKLRQAAQDQAIADFWASLSPEERSRMEREAVDQSNAFTRQFSDQPGSLGETTKKGALDAYALKMMRVTSGGGPTSPTVDKANACVDLRAYPCVAPMRWHQ